MAAVSLSPTPTPFSAMSSTMSGRRVPLSANPNAANSPLRGAATSAAAAAFAKQRRSHASLQREENYGQPPPAKKQMLDSTTTSVRAASVRSPTARRAQQAQRGTSARVYQDRASAHHSHQQEIQKISEKEAEVVRRWQQSQRLRFPKLVFYFDSLPEDHSARLSKQVTYLGAREDKFFSIDITHVVTTRPIPPEEKPLTKQQQQQQQAKEHSADHAPEMVQEHVQTINPSLLSRNTNDVGLSTSLPVKRKLFDTALRQRMPLVPFGAAEDAIRKPKSTRSTDILQRAREMGKKIWSLEKLQRVLDMLLEPDPYRSAELGQRIRNGGGANGVSAHHMGSRFTGDQALLQMLDKERHSGPSDRDPTVATRELIYFKGPYIYVYDIEEKQRPTMVREYAKVADKEEGDWPQLRPSGGTRCPFIEDTDQLELRAEKRRARMRSAREAASTATAAAAGGSNSLQRSLAASRHISVAAPRPVTGKRSLAEMEDGHHRHNVAAVVAVASSRHTEGVVCSTAAASAGTGSSALSAIPVASAVPKTTAMDFQNAFTSRAKSARCLAGEPVASGLQAAGITSAIRSQMISSATGTLGARAGTSKEIHGLQRKVLQKSTTSTSQQDLSSRRLAEMSMEQQNQQRPGYNRSTSVGRSTTAQVSTKLNAAHHDGTSTDDKHKRTLSAPVAVQPPRPKKRDPKSGYCENCQDKFDDFEDHILSHKHRKFAEDNRNWTDLDDLISQLTRCPRHGVDQWQ